MYMSTNQSTIDNLQNKLYRWRSVSKQTDKEFSISNKVKEVAMEIVNILEANNIKITYKNLTDCNYHFLVKVLNYNKKLKVSKEISEELKKLRLWK